MANTQGLFVGVVRVTVRMDGESTGVRRVYGIIGGPGPPTEAGSLVVTERLLDSRLVVHDEGTVLGDRLTDRPPLEDQDLGPFAPGRDLQRGIRRKHRTNRRRQRPVTDADRPRSNTYSVRTVSEWAVTGRVSCASGSNRACQMAISDSGCDAQESGGGDNGTASPNGPATTVTSTVRPVSSLSPPEGSVRRHSIVK